MTILISANTLHHLCKKTPTSVVYGKYIRLTTLRIISHDNNDNHGCEKYHRLFRTINSREKYHGYYGCIDGPIKKTAEPNIVNLKKKRFLSIANIFHASHMVILHSLNVSRACQFRYNIFQKMQRSFKLFYHNIHRNHEIH